MNQNHLSAYCVLKESLVLWLDLRFQGSHVLRPRLLLVRSKIDEQTRTVPLESLTFKP